MWTRRRVDSETCGLGNVKTWKRVDSRTCGLEDVWTRGRVDSRACGLEGMWTRGPGTRERDKQTTSDICAELGESGRLLTWGMNSHNLLRFPGIH